MYFKLILVLFAVIACNGQQRLPVYSTQKYAAGVAQTIPSGPTRQFLTYPTVRRGGHEDALAIAAPLIRGYVAPPPVEALEKVATLGLTNGLTGGIALGARAQYLGPVIAAILTQRTAEVIDVPVPQDVIQPQVLIVEPNLLPVTIEFRSQSSPVNINQVHIPGPPGEVKETRSEEEPDRVLHEVVKPVIQEVREIIQPYRRITQEILPVQEEVHSVVARGENHKVLQEAHIPPPQPIAIHAVAAAQPAIAVAQPVVRVAQPVAFERTIAVQPVINALGQAHGPALTGTVVRAGFIGGARVLEAPGGHADNALIGSGSRYSEQRVPAKRETSQDRPSVNNRPSGPVKREITSRHL